MNVALMPAPTSLELSRKATHDVEPYRMHVREPHSEDVVPGLTAPFKTSQRWLQLTRQKVEAARMPKQAFEAEQDRHSTDVVVLEMEDLLDYWYDFHFSDCNLGNVLHEDRPSMNGVCRYIQYRSNDLTYHWTDI